MIDGNASLISVDILELEETNCALGSNLSTTAGMHETLHVCEENQLQEDQSLLQDVIKR